MSVFYADFPTSNPPVTSIPPALPVDFAVAQPATDEGFGFFDFLDMINPLQHIPVVSTLYRQITGDEMGQMARVVGGGLFGGGIGLIAAVADITVKQMTGDYTGDLVMAALSDEQKPADPAPEILAADILPPSPAPNAAKADQVLDGWQVQMADLRTEGLNQMRAANNPFMQAATHDVPPDDTPKHAISQAMLNALDKYEEMARVRQTDRNI